jgi:hypothetical protein
VPSQLPTVRPDQESENDHTSYQITSNLDGDMKNIFHMARSARPRIALTLCRNVMSTGF